MLLAAALSASTILRYKDGNTVGVLECDHHGFSGLAGRCLGRGGTKQSGGIVVVYTCMQIV
jgi:hypothetical protein